MPLNWVSLLTLAVVSSSSSRSQRIAERLDKLSQWLVKENVEQGSVEMKETSNAGVGLFASKDLPKGEVFVRVPLSAVLSVEHVSLSNISTILSEDDMDKLSNINLMALFIAYERKHGDRYKGYLESMPDPQDINTPLFYPPKITALVDKIPFGDFLKRRMDAVRKTYPTFTQAIRDVVSMEEFKWGLSVLWSRTFLIQVRDHEGAWQRAACNVPLADMLNTGAVEDWNSDCATNKQSTHFECFTTQSVHNGQELLAPYGSRRDHNKPDYDNDLGDEDNSKLDNEKIFLDYGFVVEKREAFAMTLALPPISQGETKKIEVCDQLKLPCDMPLFSVGMTVEGNVDLPAELIAYTRLLFVANEAMTHFGPALPTAITNLASVFDLDLEIKVFQTIESQVKMALQGFANDDEQRYKALVAGDCSTIFDAELCESHSGTLRSIYALRSNQGHILNSLKSMFKRAKKHLAEEKKKETADKKKQRSNKADL